MRVVSDAKWSSYTPASEQEMYAETFLMRVLNEENCWHLVDSAWKSGLTPEGSLVRFGVQPEPEPMFVIRTYRVAFVGWPAKQLAPNLWAHDLEADLTWRTVFDFEAWGVLPTEAVSPLHLYLEAVLYMTTHALT